MKKFVICQKGTNVIEHSGIPGIKKGVRHGPPYPIDEATRRAMAAAAEEKRNTDNEWYDNRRTQSLRDSLARIEENKYKGIFKKFSKTNDQKNIASALNEMVNVYNDPDYYGPDQAKMQSMIKENHKKIDSITFDSKLYTKIMQKSAIDLRNEIYNVIARTSNDKFAKNIANNFAKKYIHQFTQNMVYHYLLSPDLVAELIADSYNVQYNLDKNK